MKNWILFLPFLAVLAVPLRAQDRLFEKVVIDFPNPVHMNDQVIPAGHYELRQLRDSSGASRVMLVTTDGANHFEAAVIPIPAVNNNTPDKTRLVVQRVGQDYYLEKIWIAGKDYGYEFSIPEDVKARIEETRGEQSIGLWLIYHDETPRDRAQQ